MSSTFSLMATLSGTTQSKDGVASSKATATSSSEEAHAFHQILNERVQQKTNSSNIKETHSAHSTEIKKPMEDKSKSSNEQHVKKSSENAHNESDKPEDSVIHSMVNQEGMTSVWQALQAAGYVFSPLSNQVNASSVETGMELGIQRGTTLGNADDARGGVLSTTNNALQNAGTNFSASGATGIVGSNATYSLASMGTPLGGGSLLGQSQSSQLFSTMMKELSLDGKGLKELTGAGMANESSSVTLSGNWASLASGTALAEGAKEGQAAASLHSIKDILGEYWVPPVQVQSLSKTEASIQMQLREGGTLTMHLQLGEGQSARLQIEAPAAMVEAMKARLAPLQEALLQQGLALAPIQWSVTKPTTAVRSVSATSLDDSHVQDDLIPDGISGSTQGTSRQSVRVARHSSSTEETLE